MSAAGIYTRLGLLQENTGLPETPTFSQPSMEAGLSQPHRQGGIPRSTCILGLGLGLGLCIFFVFFLPAPELTTTNPPLPSLPASLLLCLGRIVGPLVQPYAKLSVDMPSSLEISFPHYRQLLRKKSYTGSALAGKPVVGNCCTTPYARARR